MRGAFKDSSVFIQLLIFAVITVAGFVAFTFLYSFLVIMKFGASPEVMQEVMQNLSNYPELIRNVQFLQTLVLFIFPAILCAWLFSDNYRDYLQVDTPVCFSVMGLTILSTLVAIPFLNLTYSVNQLLVFPEPLKGLEEWIRNAEDAANAMLEKMLYVRTGWDLALNILIVCVLTGIGEEFIFRGVLQNIFGKIIRNPHIVIWTVAIVFSTIHFQFYGFVPRMLLGAYFGYLLHYTKNIWVPVLGHFTYNCSSVLIYFRYQDMPEKLKEVDTIGWGSTWWLAVVSFILFLFLFRKIQTKSKTILQ
jgi:membrane protease YdiL (CAAX protease family)